MTLASVAQFSMIWEGISTKSLGTDVPERLSYFTSESRPCSAWPNSWNNVVASSKVRREGLPPEGLVKLHTTEIIGAIRSFLFSPCERKLVIQAPPLLDALGKK